MPGELNKTLDEREDEEEQKRKAEEERKAKEARKDFARDAAKQFNIRAELGAAAYKGRGQLGV